MEKESAVHLSLLQNVNNVGKLYIQWRVLYMNISMFAPFQFEYNKFAYINAMNLNMNTINLQYIAHNLHGALYYKELLDHFYEFLCSNYFM